MAYIAYTFDRNESLKQKCTTEKLGPSGFMFDSAAIIGPKADHRCTKPVWLELKLKLYNALT